MRGGVSKEKQNADNGGCENRFACGDAAAGALKHFSKTTVAGRAGRRAWWHSACNNNENIKMENGANRRRLKAGIEACVRKRKNGYNG